MTGSKPLERFSTLACRHQPLIISLILAAASLVFLPVLNRNNFPVEKLENISIAEAQSILRGEIALPIRLHDTAFYNGKILNVFQPGQTIFFLIHLMLAGDRGIALFPFEIFLAFVLSVFLFSLALFRLSDGQAVISASLAISAMFGAPYIASFPMAADGNMYRANHCLSILFISAFLALVSSKFFRQRLFLIGLCIGAATLFRTQNVLLLFLPLSLLLQDPEGRSWQVSEAVSTSVARKALVGQVAKLLVFPLLAVIIIAGFQVARFGNPFELGYMYIYNSRSDYLAQRAKDFGLFSLHFLPENLYRTLLAFPVFEIRGWQLLRIVGDFRGNSILFSQPILFLLLFLKKGWGTAKAKPFLFVSLLLTIPVLLYHNPGLKAPGYIRLSLDYLPIWIATIAVFARYAPRSKDVLWASVISALWAVFYVIALLKIGVGV